MLSHFRRVKSSLVLRKEHLYFVVALADLSLSAFREGQNLIDWLVLISHPRRDEDDCGHPCIDTFTFQLP